MGWDRVLLYKSTCTFSLGSFAITTGFSSSSGLVRADIGLINTQTSSFAQIFVNLYMNCEKIHKFSWQRGKIELIYSCFGCCVSFCRHKHTAPREWKCKNIRGRKYGLFLAAVCPQMCPAEWPGYPKKRGGRNPKEDCYNANAWAVPPLRVCCAARPPEQWMKERPETFRSLRCKAAVETLGNFFIEKSSFQTLKKGAPDFNNEVARTFTQVISAFLFFVGIIKAGFAKRIQIQTWIRWQEWKKSADGQKNMGRRRTCSAIALCGGNDELNTLQRVECNLLWWVKCRKYFCCEMFIVEKLCTKQKKISQHIQNWQNHPTGLIRKIVQKPHLRGEVLDAHGRLKGLADASQIRPMGGEGHPTWMKT